MKYRLRMLAFLLCSAVLMVGCQKQGPKVIKVEDSTKESLVFFSPIARGNEKVQSNALIAFEQAMREFTKENTDVELQYKSYTQKDYQDKNYDQVVLERVRGDMGDDVIIMNPDVVQALYPEGYLYDMANLESAGAMTDAARQQCTIDGQVVSVPMTMIAYGLFVNVNLLEQYGLAVPETKQEFLHCCEVLKENGIMPLAGNRWWMENFVLTQGFAGLYLEEGVQEKIRMLNQCETPISSYLRPGFEFLGELIEKEYFDVKFAAKAEAGDERDLFLDGQVAFVVHNDAAVDDAVYGTHTFNMEIIGFPTDEYGQVNLMNASQRICINSKSKKIDAAVRLAETMCSKESITNMLKENGGFSPRSDVKVPRNPMLDQVYANVDSGHVIPGQNPDIKVEQWGNTCKLIQEMLAGSSVDEVLQRYDELQKEAGDCEKPLY